LTLSKTKDYRRILNDLPDWENYLLQECGLPGPRANLELLQAVADEGNEALFRRYLESEASQAEANSPYVFLVACGVVGLGKLLADGQAGLLAEIRSYASDPRWRVREAVVMALERWAQADPAAWLQAMEVWSTGSWLEKRAAIAAMCHPYLLKEAEKSSRVLTILDEVTASLPAMGERRNEEFRVLRQTLGYCWSVAAAANPGRGKALLEKWSASEDPDVQWILRENLKKNRLALMDATWVETMAVRLHMR
jgi:hypothetical protein